MRIPWDDLRLLRRELPTILLVVCFGLGTLWVMRYVVGRARESEGRAYRLDHSQTPARWVVVPVTSGN